MQVSSGVSVAYFSSIALLGLAASQEASPDGEGDTTTYFDSVVFLTMFLLIGEPDAPANFVQNHIIELMSFFSLK